MLTLVMILDILFAFCLLSCLLVVVAASWERSWHSRLVETAENSVIAISFCDTLRITLWLRIVK